MLAIDRRIARVTLTRARSAAEPAPGRSRPALPNAWNSTVLAMLLDGIRFKPRGAQRTSVRVARLG
jgi:hypothetical protein